VDSSSSKKATSTKASSRYGTSNVKDIVNKTTLLSTVDQTNPMEADSDFANSSKSDMRACHLGSELNSEPRQTPTAFYLAQTLPSEMHMTPGSTDREFKSSVEPSPSSHASFGNVAIN
jgi:hypothetical protein